MAYEVITLNLIPSGEVPVIHAAQFDKARPLNFALKLGDDDFDPSGYDLELQIRKVDNNIVTAAPASTSGNVVTFNSTEQMTACSGTNLGEIQITKDDLDIATLHFYLVVQRDVLAGGVTSESDIYNLTEQIAEIVPQVIGDDYYNKEEVDEKIAEVPTFDPTNYYDKSETDALLNDKADVSDLPDMNDYYTKSEVDTKITDLYQIKTASGSIVHITDGGNNIPVKSLVSEIVAVESGNGEKSPDNPYSISGFDNGIITRCGKNWFNDTVGTHTVTANTDQIIYIGNVWLKANQTYVISCKQTPNVLSSFVRNILVVVGNGQTVYNSAGNDYTIKPMVFTPTASGIYAIRLWGHTLPVNTSYSDFQVELDTATTYEAYKGNTYTFAFGQTVYGGHFDNKGNLVVTHKILSFNYQSDWRYENLLGGNFYVACGSDVKASQFGDDLSCNCSPSSSILAVTSNTCLISVAKNFNFTWGGTLGITNVDDFKTYLQTNNLVIKVKCLLATPITLSITSQDIPTLLGENNIYSNTGDVEVQYFTSKSDGIAELIKAFM